jgi:hypothetical protein
MRISSLALAHLALASLPLPLAACGDEGDAAPALPEGVTACAPFAETSDCPAGETCTWVGDVPAPICAPAGDAAIGEACGDQTLCAEGVCLALNGSASRCFALCRDAADCGAEGCLDLDGAAFRICDQPGLNPACDLLAPTCAAGSGCFIVAGEETPVCVPAGDVAPGGACEYANSCLVGDACINGSCRDLCDPAGAALPACADGATCTAIPETNAGFCAPAAPATTP